VIHFVFPVNRLVFAIFGRSNVFIPPIAIVILILIIRFTLIIIYIYLDASYGILYQIRVCFIGADLMTFATHFEIALFVLTVTFYINSIFIFLILEYKIDFIGNFVAFMLEIALILTREMFYGQFMHINSRFRVIKRLIFISMCIHRFHVPFA